jgi:hypothetical protein
MTLAVPKDGRMRCVVSVGSSIRYIRQDHVYRIKAVIRFRSKKRKE